MNSEVHNLYTCMLLNIIIITVIVYRFCLHGLFFRVSGLWRDTHQLPKILLQEMLSRDP